MTSNDPQADVDDTMDAADEANGDGRHDDEPINDTEARYGENESPA